MRDSRTRTSANSAATKKAFSKIKTKAAIRLSVEKIGSSKAKGPRSVSDPGAYDMSGYCQYRSLRNEKIIPQHSGMPPRAYRGTLAMVS